MKSWHFGDTWFPREGVDKFLMDGGKRKRGLITGPLHRFILALPHLGWSDVRGCTSIHLMFSLLSPHQSTTLWLLTQIDYMIYFKACSMYFYDVLAPALVSNKLSRAAVTGGTVISSVLACCRQGQVEVKRSNRNSLTFGTDSVCCCCWTKWVVNDVVQIFIEQHSFSNCLIGIFN